MNITDPAAFPNAAVRTSDVLKTALMTGANAVDALLATPVFGPLLRLGDETRNRRMLEFCEPLMQRLHDAGVMTRWDELASSERLWDIFRDACEAASRTSKEGCRDRLRSVVLTAVRSADEQPHARFFLELAAEMDDVPYAILKASAAANSTRVDAAEQEREIAIAILRARGLLYDAGEAALAPQIPDVYLRLTPLGAAFLNFVEAGSAPPIDSTAEVRRRAILVAEHERKKIDDVEHGLARKVGNYREAMGITHER